jgi:hypothetical protein
LTKLAEAQLREQFLTYTPTDAASGPQLREHTRSGGRREAQDLEWLWKVLTASTTDVRRAFQAARDAGHGYELTGSAVFQGVVECGFGDSAGWAI